MVISQMSLFLKYCICIDAIAIDYRVNLLVLYRSSQNSIGRSNAFFRFVLSRAQFANAQKIDCLRGYFSFTLEVMDWITIEAILKAFPRSLMWCRRAIQSKSV